MHELEIEEQHHEEKCRKKEFVKEFDTETWIGNTIIQSILDWMWIGEIVLVSNVVHP